MQCQIFQIDKNFSPQSLCPTYRALRRCLWLGLTLTAMAMAAPGAYSQSQCETQQFSSAEQQVIDAYIAFYGRAPDLGGLDFWSGRLEQEGGDLSSIIQAFGVSKEFDDRFGSLPNDELVNNLFLQLFGRDADPEGLAFFVGELESGRRTLQSISLDILNGAQNEDVTIIENRALVAQHYVTEAISRDTELDGSTIFTILESVTDDSSSANGACASLTSRFDSTGGSGDVAGTLARLNIDTERTPRIDAEGDPLPEDYTPIGPRATLGGGREIYLAGLTRLGETDNSSLLRYSPASAGQAASTQHLPGFTLDTSWKNSVYNAVASGDFDGDGFEEIAQLWWNSSNNAITLAILEDKSDGFRNTEPSVLTTAEPSFLQVIAADLDGDGIDEVIVAIVEDSFDMIRLNVLQGNIEDGYNFSNTSKNFSASQENSTLSIELSGAQLDRDAGQELVVVTSETRGGGRNGSPGSGTSNYWVYDDMNMGLMDLASGRISAFVDNQTYDGVTGTLAVGDFDGDNLDEIVLAALADSFPVECEQVLTVQFALDDRLNNFEVLGAGVSGNRISNCESSGNSGWTSYLWADAVDIDGDGYDELHINGVVFEDFFNELPFTPMQADTGGGDIEPLVIPSNYLFRGPGNNRRLVTTRSNTVMTTGDITADGNDEILVYMPDRVGLREVTQGNVSFIEQGYAVTAWGIDPFTGEWGLQYFEELDSLHDNEENFGPPGLVTANVDNDATVLRYAGTHEVVFTEPIVLAVLAAPPCWDTGVQVTDVCQTSWGSGSVFGGSASLSHEVSASAHVGGSGKVNLPFIGDVGLSVKETVGGSLAVEASVGYETRRTITYTTGPMEDTVVATIIPYDRYTYTILSHPVYPNAVGEELVISIPRSPRTIQIERQFFNQATVGTGVQIGSEVLSHTIGNVNSYPNRSEMLSTISLLGSRIGPVDVGASNGSTSVEISEDLVAGLTTSVSVFYEKEVEADAGAALAGFTVGNRTTASLGVTVGTSVVYGGTVGDMPPATFSLELGYSYGLFAYSVRHSSGQQFQVINYWVE